MWAEALTFPLGAPEPSKPVTDWRMFCTMGFPWKAPAPCKVSGLLKRCASGGHLKGVEKSEAEPKLNRVHEYLRKEALAQSDLFKIKAPKAYEGDVLESRKREVLLGEFDKAPLSKEAFSGYRDLPRPYECNTAMQWVEGVVAQTRLALGSEPLCFRMGPLPENTLEGKEGRKVGCNCAEETQKSDTAEDAPVILEDGFPRSRFGKRTASALLKHYNLHRETTAEENIEGSAKLARIARYLREQESSKEVGNTQITFGLCGRFRSEPAPTPVTAVRTTPKKFSGPDSKNMCSLTSTSVKWEDVLKHASEIIFDFSFDKWVSKTWKTEHKVPAVENTPNGLEKFIKQWGGYGINLINAQFGTLSSPRLGKREWIIIRADERKDGKIVAERSQAENLRRYQEEVHYNVSETIQRYPELYRGNLQKMQDTWACLRAPGLTDRNDRRRLSKAYRTAEPMHVAYQYSVSCFGKDYEFLNACADLKLLHQPKKPTVRYVGKAGGQTRKEIEKNIDEYFASAKPYRGEDKSEPVLYKEADTTLSRFLNAGTVETGKHKRGSFGTLHHYITPKNNTPAFLLQKGNGAWYLAKSYRKSFEVQRKELYLGMDVCHRGASAEKKRRQALRYCTKKSKAAFRAMSPHNISFAMQPQPYTKDIANALEGWMEWRSIRYALRQAIAADDPLRLAGSIGSEEGGGWSSIYTSSSKEDDQIDAMSKQSLLSTLEGHYKQLDAAHRSARNGVFNYNTDDYDYNEQDKNTALLKTNVLARFVVTDDGEDEDRETKELITVEETPREEPKDEKEEEEPLKKKPKRRFKEQSSKEFQRIADMSRSNIGTRIRGNLTAVWEPLHYWVSAAKKFTVNQEVLCTACEQMQPVLPTYTKSIVLLCGHRRPVCIWMPLNKA